MQDGAVTVTGSAGADVTTEEANAGARQCAIQALAALRAALGTLDRVKGVVKVDVFVASASGFTEQPAVANGASDLLVEVFGEEGRHARAAVGVKELPLGATVEVGLLAGARLSGRPRSKPLVAPRANRRSPERLGDPGPVEMLGERDGVLPRRTQPFAECAERDAVRAGLANDRPRAFDQLSGEHELRRDRTRAPERTAASTTAMATPAARSSAIDAVLARRLNDLHHSRDFARDFVVGPCAVRREPHLGAPPTSVLGLETVDHRVGELEIVRCSGGGERIRDRPTRRRDALLAAAGSAAWNSVSRAAISTPIWSDRPRWTHHPPRRTAPPTTSGVVPGSTGRRRSARPAVRRPGAPAARRATPTRAQTLCRGRPRAMRRVGVEDDAAGDRSAPPRLAKDEPIAHVQDERLGEHDPDEGALGRPCRRTGGSARCVRPRRRAA